MAKMRTTMRAVAQRWQVHSAMVPKIRIQALQQLISMGSVQPHIPVQVQQRPKQLASSHSL